MSIFETVFSLVGLVLGLALVEVLAGLARTMRARGDIHVGWLSPLLGVYVLCDVTTFWGSAWEMRDLMPSVWPSLGTALVITSVYYLAASLIFPPDYTDQSDLDAHYWKNKRFVLGLILACNCVTWIIGLMLGRIWAPTVIIINAAYATAVIALLLLRGRRINIGLLTTLILIMAWSFATP